jgi:hypothetical protein
MNTADGQNAASAKSAEVADSNAFALWRLRADALYFRPDAWDSVERLKVACAAEPRLSWLETLSGRAPSP